MKRTHHWHANGQEYVCYTCAECGLDFTQDTEDGSELAGRIICLDCIGHNRDLTIDPDSID